MPPIETAAAKTVISYEDPMRFDMDLKGDHNQFNARFAYAISTQLYSCDPEEWYFGDDTKLKQIIINILSNAIKFTNPPGKVTFMVEKVAYFDSQSTIRFTIKDTGIGMDESFLPNIFDAFTKEDSSRSNRYGSTGLGMAITKNIVEMMNGSITVDSKKGVGSTFKVTVTLKDCDRPGNKKEFDPNLVKALVIDDDEIALKNTSLVLENIGISCDTVASGAEALKAMEINHAKHEPYNLVFVDWKMPDRNGLESTVAIRGLDRVDARKIPIIALTANAFDEDVKRSLQVGMNAHLSKPVEPSRLYSTLEELID